MAIRIGSFLFGILFAYAASLQFNDPDPVRWILVYGIAALLSFFAVFRRPRRAAPLLLAVLALAWAITLLPGIYRAAAFTGTEEERECLGLLIVAGWMLALAAAGRRRRRRRRA